MNSHVQVQSKIVKNLQHFDSRQLSEVLDFVEFLNFKGRSMRRKPAKVDEVFGKYRDSLSSSEEFSQNKKVEKEKETLKWERNSKSVL